MAKKFGKFLLFSAAVGAAAVGAYYYLQKKDALNAEEFDEDEDYDDFSDDLDDDEDVERSYVSLGKENLENAAKNVAQKAEDVMDDMEEFAEDTSDYLKDMAKQAEEKVEEFFDDDEA